MGGKRVLVVDDSPLILQIVRGLLEGIPGIQVSCESDGTSALKKLSESEVWDLILLDMEMPQMGGLEVLETLRRRGRTDFVAAFTGDADPELRGRLAALGVEIVLPKPVDADVLTALVTDVPRSVRAKGSVSHGSTLQRFNGNLELYRRSLAKFVEEYGPWAALPVLGAAFRTLQERRFFLHTLKGVAAYLGGQAIVQSIEEWQNHPEDGEGARLQAALRQFLEDVAAYLAEPRSEAPASAPPGPALEKGLYLASVRDLVVRHDSALIDLPRYTTKPPLTGAESLLLDQILALVQDYEFDRALPLADQLAGPFGGGSL